MASVGGTGGAPLSRIVSVSYSVRMRGVEIGASDLEHFDANVGVAYGTFRPGAGYELVQDIFRLYAEASPETPTGGRDEESLERYYRARDALGLELVDARGRLVPTSAIDVSDYSREAGTEAYEVFVYLADPSGWTRSGSPRAL